MAADGQGTSQVGLGADENVLKLDNGDSGTAV